MQQLSFKETLSQIEKKPLNLVYISAPNCSVCHAVKPRVEQLFQNKNLPMFALDIIEAPEVAGTFQVMTAPAILVFYQGKEVHRQARFIDFKRLETLVTNYQQMEEVADYSTLFEIDQSEETKKSI